MPFFLSPVFLSSQALYRQNRGWSDGSDGSLIVENGNTVYLDGGRVYNFNDVNIKDGGVVVINDTADMTVIACCGAFILDGQLQANGYLFTNNIDGSFFEQTYQSDYTFVKGGDSGKSVFIDAASGGGIDGATYYPAVSATTQKGGNSPSITHSGSSTYVSSAVGGAGGKNGLPLFIYAYSISGAGTIDLSGGDGSVGGNGSVDSNLSMYGGVVLASGGGGGGAGGEGGSLWLKYSAGSHSNLSILQDGGNGGAGGTKGVSGFEAYASATNGSTGNVGATGKLYINGVLQ